MSDVDESRPARTDALMDSSMRGTRASGVSVSHAAAGIGTTADHACAGLLDDAPAPLIGVAGNAMPEGPEPMHASPDAIVGREGPDVHSAAAEYTRRFAGSIGAHLLNVQTEAVRKLVTRVPGGRALDVGGGHGQTAGLLGTLGFGVTVLGSSERAFDQLRQKRLFCETVVGDLAHMPFDDQSFDLVISVRMMAHVGDWTGFVRELCRVSASTVIIDFARSGGSNILKPLLFGLKKRFEGNTRPFSTMRADDVYRQFEASGFRVDLTVGQFVLPMALHRAVGAPAFSRITEAALASIGLDRWLGTPVILRAVRQRSASGG